MVDAAVLDDDAVEGGAEDTGDRDFVEMFRSLIVIVGSRVGILSFSAKGSSCRSTTSSTSRLFMLANALGRTVTLVAPDTRTDTTGLSVLNDLNDCWWKTTVIAALTFNSCRRETDKLSG